MLKNIYPAPPILPPAEHPRLMLRRKDFSRIRENMTKGSSDTAARIFDELCSTEIKGEGADPAFGTYHLKEYLAVEAKALKALLDDDENRGREVISDLLRLVRTAKYRSTIMTARFSGHLIFIASEVYDWCYPWLSDAERREIISACEKLAKKYFEMSYPPVRQSAISGHGTEAQLLRDLLSFGIAVYDERPDIYDLCAGRLFSEYIPVFEKVFAGGFHPQGPSYGSYRHTGTMWFGLLILAMSGEKVLPACVETLADSFLYLTRSDGEMLRLGDDCNEGKALYSQKNPFAVPLFLSAAYTGNGLYYHEAPRQMHPSYLLPSRHGVDYYEEGSYGEGLMSPCVYLIWDGLTPPEDTPPLPAARYFGFPVGCTVYNDGERLVLMKIGELWGANHDHLDTGCFQIYDGEILASDSGVYDAYHTPHRMKYYIHTVAHNCLLVDGRGTRFPYDLEEPKNPDHWFSEYGMALVTYHGEKDGVYEIEGDLTEAYVETCELVTRRMRWEPARGERGVFTVKDVVIPKREANVTFLLHCQREPEIRGNEIVIPGKNRKLVCRVVSPAEVRVVPVTGEGRQFVKDGVNYEPKTRLPEEGIGRVEITARGKRVEFLVQIEIRKA
ncbi:MAG: heparinase II/III family protein [Clostridia bacterium]|nr:heparinase II/III family protein [Clostridia bacterium]